MYRRFQHELASSAILVLGCPRSGTTWLAKIIDSHPDILYRHEPDEVRLPRAEAEPFDQINEWIAQRSLRTAAKRPAFRKSWRPAPVELARNAISVTLAAIHRLPVGARYLRGLSLPDLIPAGKRAGVRAAIKLVNWDGSAAARTMPGCRCCLIIRHPCGQIASVKAGLTSGQFRFSGSGSAPADLASTALFAAGHGVGATAFAELPDAAKFAWSWRAFNESAVAGLSDLPNARVVIYEDLCQRTEDVAKDLFQFAGLAWSSQTAEFINQSTQQKGAAGYYDVYRSTPAVPDQWRSKLSQVDQDAVQSVVRQSPLAHHWPDLAAA